MSADGRIVDRIAVAEQTVRFADIRSRILGGDYYPFAPGHHVGPRYGYAHAFIYIRRGRGTIAIAGQTYEARTGDLYYIAPGMMHQFHADEREPMAHGSVYADLLGETSPKQRGDRALNVHGAERYDSRLAASRVVFAEGLELPRQYRAGRGRSPVWIAPLLGVIDEFGETGWQAEVRLRGLFETFLAGWVRELNDPTAVPGDPRVSRLIRWMREHPEQRFSAAAWAAEFGISEAYLFELFRARTGTSPLRYFQDRKLELAKRELRETELTVTGIAAKLGYSSVHYFSRHFAASFGESPLAYRRRTRPPDL